MPPLRMRSYLAALPSVIRERAETRSYREYVTDALRLKGEGKYNATRWRDIIDPPQPPKEDDRPAEVIAAEIWDRAGIGGGK